MYLLEERLPIKTITVMVQKEAAQRLCAEVGSRESGAITVAVNYYGRAKQLFGVSRGSFMPSPNVDSAVIRIDPYNEPKLPVDEEKFFFKVVKSGFSQRRKTAANAVSSQLGIPKECVFEALRATGLNENVRLENLDLDSLMGFTCELRKLSQH